jgi:hypothetical protein
MALTRLVSGIQREVWQETLQNGGVSQVIHTNIRISAAKLPCVQGLLAVGTPAGSPVFTATPSVSATGYLDVTVENTAIGGNSAPWVLDVRLVQSSSQANDAAISTGYILVANAATSGLLAPETLAAAYGIGASSGDQTLVLTTADGDGIIIDGVTQAGSAGLYALEVREGTNYPIAAITRRGDDATGPVLELNKARGAFGAPADLQANDYFGVINFVGRVNNVSNPYAVIEAMVLSIGAGPTITTALDFYATYQSAPAHVWRMNATAAGSMLIGYGTQPIVQPDTTETGCLGQTDHIWDLAYINTVFAYDNLSLGGASILGGADHTIVLPNTAKLPTPQTDQVYLGALDWGGTGGAGHAALAISSEELASVTTGATGDRLVPFTFNGVPLFLLALNKAPT